MDKFIGDINNIFVRGFKYWHLKGFDKEDQSDPRYMIRMCPHCKTPGMKSDGWRGVTHCG